MLLRLLLLIILTIAVSSCSKKISNTPKDIDTNLDNSASTNEVSEIDRSSITEKKSALSGTIVSNSILYDDENIMVIVASELSGVVRVSIPKAKFRDKEKFYAELADEEQFSAVLYFDKDGVVCEGTLYVSPEYKQMLSTYFQD